MRRVNSQVTVTTAQSWLVLSNQRHPRMRSEPTYLCALIAQILLRPVIGHYIGEPLQTTVLSSEGKLEAMKAQRPLFGVDSNVKITRSKGKFSLGFEENHHQLPWLETMHLRKLRVTFVYSRSGDGLVASVSSQPMMKTTDEEHSPHQLDVEYRWVEELPVSISSGCIVMFLATFLVSLLLVLSLCAYTDDGDTYVGLEENDRQGILLEKGTSILHND
jgi:hypothetical protein